jgi:lipopolysaccharide export system permease protein
MRLEKGGTFDIIARAKEAKLRVDRAKRLLWIDMRNCEIVGAVGDQARVVEDRSWPVDLPAEFEAPTKMRPTDMTWQELDPHRAERLKIAEEVLNRIREAQAVVNHSGASDPQAVEHLRNLQNTYRLLMNEVTAIDVEKHMRPAIAMGCLCFVLVGCPVGIWFGKSDYLSAFITCFLPIIIVYYPLLLSGINAAKGLKLTPLVIWSANGVMLLVAVPLFARLARH